MGRAGTMTLTWGVKQSFRNYVEATGGRIEASQGAQRAPDGAFTFAAAPGEGLTLDAAGKPNGRACFKGEVSFEAHGGMLSVQLADPTVEIGSSGGVLSVADLGTGGRVEVARLDLAESSEVAGELVIPAALTPEGSQWLGDHYPIMTALDPLRLAIAER